MSFSKAIFQSLSHIPLKSHEYLHTPPSTHAYLIANMFKNNQTSIIYPLSYYDDLQFLIQFFTKQNIPVFTVPFYDLLVYEDGSPSQNILIERMQGWVAIKNKTPGIYLVALKSLLFGVPNKQVLESELCLSIKVGNTLNRHKWAEHMLQWEYFRTPQIDSINQFSIKGEILEIAGNSEIHRTRIYLNDDIIEKILLVNTQAQVTESVNSTMLYSCIDFLYTKQKNSLFLEFLKKEKAPHQIEYFQEYQNHHNNIHYIPFFYKTSLLDLFAEFSHSYTLLINNKPQLESAEKNWSREIKEMFSSSFNIHKVMIHPSDYFTPLNTVLSSSKHTIYFSPFASEHQETSLNMLDYIQPIPLYNGKIEQFHIDLEKYADYTTTIFADTEMTKEKIHAIFPHLDINIYSGLQHGFISLMDKKIYITDKDLFGKKQTALKTNKTFISESSAIDHFSDLSKGDHIVHIHHGIGIYQGIEKMSIMGAHKDYIKISYADEENLYIPVEQIFLVHKYLGSTDPVLNNIGGKSWETKKNKVSKQIEDMSEDLLILYETRKKSAGFPFPPDSPFQEQFEALFPYTPTEGQIQSIEEIKKDMESPFVMDRLLCGDVGYGKTEVSARAVFKAVSAGKQVAFLAPTTLLVEQHYRSFKVRFADFPINIRYISRSISTKEQKEIHAGLADGTIDIILGTHSLFSAKIQFKDLGLLIIDEEQRFGVKHKEKMKEKNPLVDTLTLSATPIPRTLYMGLSSFRDMSVINTPPVARLPIKTYVMPFNDEIISSAIQREIERGGQVFIIHNRVKTINTFTEFIQKICPNARILIGHAQMPAHEMERVFMDFVSHKADILIATTIIESGIDITNANTMIIDKPEMFGLGELYQLRGRVGRGKKQGYAYLFYDANTGLTPNMQQRLESIEENTSLGSGFQIAMRDLEIRGAGNLLGKSQSGLCDGVGIELYSQMLKKVVHKIKGTPMNDIEPVMDLPFEGHIPEGYITQEQERFLVYKTLMKAKNQIQLQEIKKNIQEFYGEIPSIMDSLFQVAHIKILAKNLKIKEFRYKNGFYEIYFIEQPEINVGFFIPFVEKGVAKILNQNALVMNELIFNKTLLDDIIYLLNHLLPENFREKAE